VPFPVESPRFGESGQFAKILEVSLDYVQEPNRFFAES
jgi:hypothetical protein